MIKFKTKDTIEYINGGLEIQNQFENNVTYLFVVTYPSGESVIFNQNGRFSIKNGIDEAPSLHLLILTTGTEYFRTNEVALTDFKAYQNVEHNSSVIEIAKLEQRIKQLEDRKTFVDKTNLNLKPAAVGSVITLVEGGKYELRQPYAKGVLSINGRSPSAGGQLNLNLADLGFNSELLETRLSNIEKINEALVKLINNLNQRITQTETNIDDINEDVL